MDLEKRSTSRFVWASFYAILIYMFAFLAIGVLALLLFGTEIEIDLLDSFGTLDGTIPIVIRVFYILILFLHLIYFNFVAKEQALVLYDELVNRSLSTHLEAKI